MKIWPVSGLREKHPVETVVGAFGQTLGYLGGWGKGTELSIAKQHNYNSKPTKVATLLLSHRFGITPTDKGEVEQHDKSVRNFFELLSDSGLKVEHHNQSGSFLPKSANYVATVSGGGAKIFVKISRPDRVEQRNNHVDFLLQSTGKVPNFAQKRRINEAIRKLCGFRYSG